MRNTKKTCFKEQLTLSSECAGPRVYVAQNPNKKTVIGFCHGETHLRVDPSASQRHI